jgi:hypothetical protein
LIEANHGRPPQNHQEFDRWNNEAAHGREAINVLEDKVKASQRTYRDLLRRIIAISHQQHILPDPANPLHNLVSQEVMEKIHEDFETLCIDYNNAMRAYLKQLQARTSNDEIKPLQAAIDALIKERTELVNYYLRVSNNLVARLQGVVTQPDPLASYQLATDLVARIANSPRLIAKVLDRVHIDYCARVNQWLAENLSRRNLRMVIRHLIHEDIQRAAETRLHYPASTLNILRGENVCDSLPGAYQQHCLRPLFLPLMGGLRTLCDAQPIVLNPQQAMLTTQEQERLLFVLEQLLTQIRDTLRSCRVNPNAHGVERDKQHALKRLFQIYAFLYCDLVKYQFTAEARKQVANLLFLRFINPTIVDADAKPAMECLRSRSLITKALLSIVNQENPASPALAFIGLGTAHNARLYRIVQEIMDILLPAAEIAAADALIEEHFPD